MSFLSPNREWILDGGDGSDSGSSLGNSQESDRPLLNTRRLLKIRNLFEKVKRQNQDTCTCSIIRIRFYSVIGNGVKQSRVSVIGNGVKQSRVNVIANGVKQSRVNVIAMSGAKKQSRKNE